MSDFLEEYALSILASICIVLSLLISISTAGHIGDMEVYNLRNSIGMETQMTEETSIVP